MKKKGRVFFLATVLTWFSTAGYSQDNVFSLMKSDTRLADEYYQEKNYRRALELYWNIYQKNTSAADLKLKIARCYYFLKDYRQSVAVFETIARASGPMSVSDLYCFAEAQASAGNYKKAMDAYRDYLKRKPGDTIAFQKLWRLSNIHYLFEDSLHYVVRPLTLNTTAGELCPVPYGKDIVFLSNRKEINLIEKVDPSDAPLFKMYVADRVADSVDHKLTRFEKTRLFSREISRHQAGPVAFFAGGTKMVFASSANEGGHNVPRRLQLYFAEEQHGAWKVTGAFPYNTPQFSFSDPSISNDGTLLYFSSDMPGGKGEKDIYRSVLVNGKWQKPESAGEGINTPYDECFPFLHRSKALYFSSNGHPGLGGLDIFKSELQGIEFGEVTNMGYPVNSRADEFGFSVDSLSAHGYFSSNRKNAGLDDDLYEVDIDLQTYPIQIDGLVRMKDHSWSDSIELRPFALAKISLIDNIRDTPVYEGMSDQAGNFSLVIPYFSKFKIKIVGVEKDEHVVSLEIPKHRKEYGRHEIVIVKDLFGSREIKDVK